MRWSSIVDKEMVLPLGGVLQGAASAARGARSANPRRQCPLLGSSNHYFGAAGGGSSLRKYQEIDFEAAAPPAAGAGMLAPLLVRWYCVHWARRSVADASDAGHGWKSAQTRRMSFAR